ncbi:unnamed protein product [Cyprideis torosa]|uniref:Uncharacterized protein n=1 Tax=Cyprideis torosa TaxID=163714 RepID=A0A7R8WDB8_9CRUS|nr:unnamed protein product [Cyprideis torosa]CAG0888414.1 unnamed protein product [Cyprideis torosa]
MTATAALMAELEKESIHIALLQEPYYNVKTKRKATAALMAELEKENIHIALLQEPYYNIMVRNYKRVNWKKFGEGLKSDLEEFCTGHYSSTEDIEEDVLKLGQIIKARVDNDIPETVFLPKRNKWWTEALSSLKKEIKRKRRKRAITKHLEEKYDQMIKEAKKEAWMKFMDSSKGLNDAMIRYRILCKSRSSRTLQPILKENTSDYTESQEESASALIQATYPSLPPDDRPEHGHIRTIVRDVLQKDTINDVPDITEEEIRMAFSRTKTNNSILLKDQFWTSNARAQAIEQATKASSHCDSAELILFTDASKHGPDTPTGVAVVEERRGHHEEIPSNFSHFILVDDEYVDYNSLQSRKKHGKRSNLSDTNVSYLYRALNKAASLSERVLFSSFSEIRFSEDYEEKCEESDDSNSNSGKRVIGRQMETFIVKIVLEIFIWQVIALETLEPIRGLHISALVLDSAAWHLVIQLVSPLVKPRVKN